jgi:ASC-1-like (ASCH) protein
MLHTLKLNETDFDLVKSGIKILEVRLFDEKRKEIKLGDIIEIQKQPELKDTVNVEVIALFQYKTFEELLNDFPIEWIGGPDTNKEKHLEKIYSFYIKEQETDYSVLGIKMKLLER